MKEQNKYQDMRDRLEKKHSKGNIVSSIIFSMIGILVSAIFASYAIDCSPIARDEALEYSGEFEIYSVTSEIGTITFRGGLSYDVMYYAETNSVRSELQTLESGTVLHVLINPRTYELIEIKTEAREILSFDDSNKAAESSMRTYMGIGGVLLIISVVVFVLDVGMIISKKRKSRSSLADETSENGALKDTEALRDADMSVKSRILLEAKEKQYNICYRRVKSVNELVINGKVYDEKKGVIEFEHELHAVVDGHKITAGLDYMSYSFISFDGELIGYKQRLI